MRNTLGLALLLLIVTGEALSSEQAKTPAEVFSAAASSVVIVKTFDADGRAVAQGSGVTVAPKTVVTNCHVFTGAQSTYVLFDGRQLAAFLINANQDHDICTLSVESLTATPANLGSAAKMKVGDTVYAIGAPQGFELTLSNGIVSSLRKIAGENILQVTAAISHGSSGGGLFNSNAKLVGITTMYIDDSQQLNFAVPVEWVRDLLEQSVRPTSETDGGREKAKASINAWESNTSKIDPNYETLRPKLVKELKLIILRYPPTQWLSIVEKTYESLTAAVGGTIYRCTDDVASTYSSHYEAGKNCIVISKYRAHLESSDIVEEEGRWETLSNHPKKIELDKETINKNGDYANAWLRSVEPDGSMRLEHYNYDCTQRTDSLQYRIIRNKNGEVSSSQAIEIGYTPIAPESINESVFALACK